MSHLMGSKIQKCKALLVCFGSAFADRPTKHKKSPRVFLFPVIPSGDQARTWQLPSITRKQKQGFTLCNTLGLGCYTKPNVVGYMSPLLSTCIWPSRIYTLNLEVMRLALLHHNLKFTYWGWLHSSFDVSFHSIVSHLDSALSTHQDTLLAFCLVTSRL